MIANFKPQLLPNNKAGEAPDWEERLEHPEDWLVSTKLDGARVELFNDGSVKGRSLKSIPSVHIQEMGMDVINTLPALPSSVVIEAEFYSEHMNFAELMHFFRSEDVTSEKSVAKYTKLWGTEKWPFPGRDVKWATTWHESLRFYAFDIVDMAAPYTRKEDRNMLLANVVFEYIKAKGKHTVPKMVFIAQWDYEHIDAIYQAYDQSIMDGNEGLVLIHKQAAYKCGRHTLNSKQAFKIKDDNLEFDGKILSVVESTVAREGAEKTVNELGRSVTSKLKEDRIPSGMASGFEVLMEDGNILTVSLKNYNHEERRQLLYDHADYSNKWIKFTGMAPVKEGGCPRHAHFTKGNFRDDK